MKDQLTGMVRVFLDMNVSILRTLYKEKAIGVCHMTDIFHVDKMPVHSVVYKKYEVWNRPRLVWISANTDSQFDLQLCSNYLPFNYCCYFCHCYWYRYSFVALPMDNTCIFGRYPTPDPSFICNGSHGTWTVIPSLQCCLVPRRSERDRRRAPLHFLSSA